MPGIRIQDKARNVVPKRSTVSILLVYSRPVTTQYGLLGLLDAEPRHGYELKQAFDRVLSPQRPLPFGQAVRNHAGRPRGGPGVAA